MLLLLVGLAFAVPLLWTVSIGAVREARALRDTDPRVGCQAWVAVRGMRRRRYRCCEPVYAGGPWCLRHEVGRTQQDEGHGTDVTLVDEPQGVGRALVRARVGIPLAVASLVGTALAAGLLTGW